MIQTTMTQDLLADIRKEMTFNEVVELADKYADKILESDTRLYGISKHIVGYGTWSARIDFANEYHYGGDIANTLKYKVQSIITHDEDKEFTIEDFDEDIRERLADYIWDKTNE